MKPGDRFGRLTVLGETDRSEGRFGPWIAARCDCGQLTVAVRSAIEAGRRIGCLACTASAQRAALAERDDRPYQRSRALRHEATAVYRAALRSGELVRADECERCGARDTQIVGHHEDYSKPLAVMWLCHPCHGVRHGELSRVPALRAEAAS